MKRITIYSRTAAVILSLVGAGLLGAACSQSADPQLSGSTRQVPTPPDISFSLCHTAPTWQESILLRA